MLRMWHIMSSCSLVAVAASTKAYICNMRMHVYG